MANISGQSDRGEGWSRRSRSGLESPGSEVSMSREVRGAGTFRQYVYHAACRGRSWRMAGGHAIAREGWRTQVPRALGIAPILRPARPTRRFDT